jgi:hypothetical protein
VDFSAARLVFSFSAEAAPVSLLNETVAKVS